MDQINSLINNPMRITSGSKPEEPTTDSTKKMVLGLFVRMAALYRNKARSEGLVIYSSEDDERIGKYSENFKLWCVKLKDLDIEDFRIGMIEMEKRAEDLYKENKEMWPPSYAEFRALCKPANNYDVQAHKQFDSAYDESTGTYRLEDQMAKQKRIEVGLKYTSDLMSLFAEPEPAPLTPEQILDNERLERIRDGV